jgi:hypothetical protein
MKTKLKDITLKADAIENVKTSKLTPFKGGLPQIPLGVGLISGLPDCVNNLISKLEEKEKTTPESKIPNYQFGSLNEYITEKKSLTIQIIKHSNYFDEKKYKLILSIL